MNCKPGDLAILINAHLKENIGMIVLVIGPSISAENAWTVQAQRQVRGTKNGGIVITDTGFVYDSWLRPVSGLPVHDEQHDEIPA